MLKKCFLLLVAFVAVAAVASAEDSEYYIPNPLGDAEVGDWVRYAVSADGNQEQRMTVVRRQGEGDDLKITVKYDTYSQGKLVNSGQTIHDAKDFTNELPAQAGHAEINIDEEEVEVKGTTLVVTVVRFAEEPEEGKKTGKTREWYLSDDIPVYGVIKQVENGEKTSSLLDFGFADPKEE